MFLKKTLKIFSRVSIRLRLALIFVFIFGAITAVFNAFLFQATIQTLQQDFDDALFNYAVDVSEGVEIGIKGDLNFPPLRLDHGKILPFPLGTALIQIRHASGAVLERSGEFGQFDPPYKSDFQKIWNGEEATYRTIQQISDIPFAEADSYRLISFPLDNGLKPQLLLQIAVPMTLLETQTRQRLTLLQLGIPLVLLIATMGGLFLSSRALAPVNHMIQTTKKIKASELSQRVPVPEAKDEIRTLALTLNEMLERIQKAFQSQERFIADASHQLLTPLTILRSELEHLGKADKENKFEYIGDFIKSTLQEVDNLSNIVQEMLLLARVDAGIGALSLQKLSLDELIFEALARCEKMAENKSIKLKFNLNNQTNEDRKYARGDNDLLFNVITNIVENAIKYSPPQETVTITLNWKSKTSELIVEDNGPGVPPDQRPLIFERFSRGSFSNSPIQGFGLGLAIAQKIAQLHGTEIKIGDSPSGGARFSFEIKNI